MKTWRDFVTPFVLLAIVLLGAALRVYRIADESVWVDESVSYPQLHQPTLGAYLAAVRVQDPPMSPMYFTLQYYWARAVGDSVVAVRILSVLLGVATLPLLYLLGALLYNRSAGLIAALCAALAIPHIYYSQEIRTYALVLLLSVASMYFLLRALHGSPAWWPAHIVCNALLLATHLFGALLVLAQALFLFAVHAKRWKTVLAWAAVHAVLFVPFALYLNGLRGEAFSHSISLIPIPSLRWLLNTYCVYYAGLEPWGGRLPDAYGPAFAVGALLLFALAACLIGTCKQEVLTSRREAFALLSIWYLVPPLVLYVVSFWATPCFVERYALSSSFALFLLVGGVFSLLNRPWWIAVVLCVLTAAYTIAH
ncbi:MAG: glycosyltransferase family 39 protein, partial [Candidatus Hydrogenedentes bacterium]|nr:glycosyltransferase family 39 protein [Candidatus Hydrogenedentota bacterium]